jgi:hypothetical protein
LEIVGLTKLLPRPQIPKFFLVKWESSWRTCMYTLHLVLVVLANRFCFFLYKNLVWCMSSFFPFCAWLGVFVGIMWAQHRPVHHSFETCCYACLSCEEWTTVEFPRLDPISKTRFGKRYGAFWKMNALPFCCGWKILLDIKCPLDTLIFIIFCKCLM